MESQCIIRDVWIGLSDPGDGQEIETLASEVETLSHPKAQELAERIREGLSDEREKTQRRLYKRATASS